MVLLFGLILSLLFAIATLYRIAHMDSSSSNPEISTSSEFLPFSHDTGRSLHNVVDHITSEPPRVHRQQSPQIVMSCGETSDKNREGVLNDDYCDCSGSGVDEVKTAACSYFTAAKETFRCDESNENSLSIFSSRVNDGVCDCSNGADEYLTKVDCQLQKTERTKWSLRRRANN
jgi:hypothetical protein